ncbi:MAG TPA: kelch repeat-containing protein [Dehalococcoidia bacterium]|nr:kelch repeat-containing protein [Dehalococcoidia bacterium]
MRRLRWPALLLALLSLSCAPSVPRAAKRSAARPAGRDAAVTPTPAGHIVHPPARNRAAMAYDAARDKVVLFGGLDATGIFLDDTWTWDNGWVQRRSAESPSYRYDAAMAYDEARQVVVLFGGCCDGLDNNGLSDTWIWDGAQWTEAHPPASPPARSQAAMAYDPRSRLVLLFGGEVLPGNDSSDDLWGWDGATWRRLTPESGPSPRVYAGLVRNVHGDGLLLFGGYRAPAPPNDTWFWDGAGTVWKQLSPAASPPARYNPVLAEDAARGEVVLFGGEYLGRPLADTWIWNGVDWNQRLLVRGPPPRQDASIAYAAAQRQVLLFGGFGATRRLDDTWLWDGASWTEW